jgi:Tfp pilus assembly protein PilV
MTTQRKPSRPQRRLRRKQTRGVVMVEALIAISMIIVMFGGVVYLHNAYAAKTRVLREARLQAWRATDVACEGGGKGIAAELATIPVTYAGTHGSDLSVTANDEMKCNEDHDERTTVTGVLSWSHLDKQLGGFGKMLLTTLGF